MENAIVELLRSGSFGKMPFFRFATDDIEFAGQLGLGEFDDKKINVKKIALA